MRNQFPALMLVVMLGFSSAVAQESGQTLAQAVPVGSGPADESTLIPIRLAARGGDFELAEQRLAELKKPHLEAKGRAALAAEYSRLGDVEKASENYQAAAEIMDSGQIRLRDKVSALLYISRLQYSDKSPGWSEKSKENYQEAFNLVGQMAGLDLDMSLIELAQTGYQLNQDAKAMESILGLIGDGGLRQKMMELYGFTDANNSGNDG